MGIDYQKWLRGNGCCCGHTHKKVDETCDCDSIWLELSKQHTDDLILQDEIDTKLDISAYTPTDLSDYYTKEEVDELIPSGSPVSVDSELSLISTNPVQNKVITEALNGKLDASAYTPTDLSNYATKSELIQYINNLQQQINSLIASISGCCGQTGETQYRWVTMTGDNDYWCSGTTKYSLEKEQYSEDGINWNDVSPEETRHGNTILEENCVDCGYVPPTPTGTTKALVISTFDLEEDLSGKTTYKASNDCNNVESVGMCVLTPHGSSNRCVDGLNCSTSITSSDLDNIVEGDRYAFVTHTYKSNSVIGNSEFYNTDVDNVTLMSGITSIGDYAFANNQYLEKVGRPQMGYYSPASYHLDLASIGNYAFANNPSLTDVTLYGLNGVPTLGTGAFDNCPNLTRIIVDTNLVNEFKSAPGWSTYSSIIYPASN